MNLSFSTRGWSDLSFEEWIDTALDMRFTGIEVYNLQKFPALEGRGGPFHKYNAAATVRLLREKKLKIPCLDSSWDLSTGEEAEEGVRHLLETAHNLQVPYVSACALRDGEETVRGALARLLPRPRGWGSPSSSRPAASNSDTARLRAILDEFASDYLGALWDIHHPYRDRGESADTTIKNLGAYVRHVHLRDSDDAHTYNLIGEGTLPWTR